MAKVKNATVENAVETEATEATATEAKQRREPVTVQRLIAYFYDVENAEVGENGVPKTLVLREGVQKQTAKEVADALGMDEGSFRTRYSGFGKMVETLGYPRPKLADGRSGRKGQKRFTEDPITRALKSLVAANK